MILDGYFAVSFVLLHILKWILVYLHVVPVSELASYLVYLFLGLFLISASLLAAELHN